MLGNAHSECDGVVMEVAFQRVDNATLNGFHLFECQLVVDDDLDVREFSDDGCHVLHAHGDAAKALWHSVAHREPLDGEFLLSKLFNLFSSFGIAAGLVDKVADDGSLLRCIEDVLP